MEDKVKEILRKCFNKYDVPAEAIEGAALQLAALLSNPLKHKTGATIMTSEASQAGDKKSGTYGKTSPEVL